VKGSSYVLFALIMCISSVHADPPFISDNPEPLNAKETEIFLYSDYTQSTVGSAWYAPAFEIDYGVFNDFEIDFLTGINTVFPRQAGNAVGLGDMQLLASYRFLHETSMTPEIAFVPTLSLPTGNSRRRLGNGKIWVQPALWAQKNWGNWRTYGGGGYTFNPAKHVKNYYIAGWVLERTINETWTLGIECYSQGAISKKIGSTTLVNLGMRYYFTPDFNLLLSVGHSFVGVPTTVSYLGLSWFFKA
jgi:hypothetical protein